MVEFAAYFFYNAKSTPLEEQFDYWEQNEYDERRKFNREQAEADGFIESMIANTWFREDTESLFSATKDGFVKISGSKKDLPKDKDGNIVLNKNTNETKNN